MSMARGKAFSGGAGLLSTASDYARFLQMLVNGGELDGVRVLSPKTVELMTANHTGTLFNEGRDGFGLGFGVIEHLGRPVCPDRWACSVGAARTTPTSGATRKSRSSRS